MATHYDSDEDENQGKMKTAIPVSVKGSDDVVEQWK